MGVVREENMDEKVANYGAVFEAFTYLNKQEKLYDNDSLNAILKRMQEQNDDEIVKTEEYKYIREAISRNPELGEMKLISQSHFDHMDRDGEIFGYSGGDCTDDPIQAYAFMDPKGKELYVCYRGTGGGRWGDNGQGFVDEKTDMQVAAQRYFDHVLEEASGLNSDAKIYVTGHSKGGNEAQYVTMMSEYSKRITGCYSFEGQGFSDKAIAMFKRKHGKDYEKVLQKMYSINSDNDPVHKLIGVIIPRENTYNLNTHYYDSNGKSNVGYCHNILGILSEGGLDWKRKNGEIINGSEGWLSKFAESLNDNLYNLPEPVRGSCAIALMEMLDPLTRWGGSMDDAYAGDLDFAIFATIGVPLILYSIDETFVSYAYENWGLIGAVISTALASAFYLQLYTFVECTVGIAYCVNQLQGQIKRVMKVIDKAKVLCQKADQWMNNTLRDIEMFIKNVQEWVFNQSPGYTYATQNPFLQISTSEMYSCAANLSQLSKRAKILDGRMNMMYLQMGISWDNIWNFANLLQAGLLLDYSYRLDGCVHYLNQTADDFEMVEKQLIH